MDDGLAHRWCPIPDYVLQRRFLVLHRVPAHGTTVDPSVAVNARPLHTIPRTASNADPRRRRRRGTQTVCDVPGHQLNIGRARPLLFHDQARTALKREVFNQPLERHQQARLTTDQKVDVA
jgi:hypothetical protein